MKVILLQDVKKVGQRGSVATVADGYAQNVLLPKKLAVAATAENIKRWEREQKELHAQKTRKDEGMHAALNALEGKTIEIRARANESGGLFEAIHDKKIAEVLEKELGFAIPPEAIQLPEPIKHTGSFSVQISLSGISTSITIVVSAS